ncbi:uncharacterized protein LOC143034989 [Oratosquilla oratoria]|uniref:uncharacterized protein LOC143034989 n=1 Tax=Oratosquilla oratoria TaxID=337810 RepID=UPI003F75DEA6
MEASGTEPISREYNVAVYHSMASWAVEECLRKVFVGLWFVYSCRTKEKTLFEYCTTHLQWEKQSLLDLFTAEETEYLYVEDLSSRTVSMTFMEKVLSKVFTQLPLQLRQLARRLHLEIHIACHLQEMETSVMEEKCRLLIGRCCRMLILTRDHCRPLVDAIIPQSEIERKITHNRYLREEKIYHDQRQVLEKISNDKNTLQETLEALKEEILVLEIEILEASRQERLGKIKEKRAVVKLQQNRKRFMSLPASGSVVESPQQPRRFTDSGYEESTNNILPQSDELTESVMDLNKSISFLLDASTDFKCAKLVIQEAQDTISQKRTRLVEAKQEEFQLKHLVCNKTKAITKADKISSALLKEKKRCHAEAEFQCKKETTLKGFTQNLNDKSAKITDFIQSNFQKIKMGMISHEQLTEALQVLRTTSTSSIGSLVVSAKEELSASYINTGAVDACSYIVCGTTAICNPIRSLISLKAGDKPVPLEDILTLHENSPYVVLVRGPGGTGKTCLGRFLLKSWTSETNDVAGLLDTSLVLHIDIDNMATDSLDDHLKTVVLPTTMKEEEMALPLTESVETLFILDVGRNISRALLVLDDVLQHLWMNKIIITIRMMAEEEVTKVLRSREIDYNIVDLCPLDRKSLTSFIKVMSQNLDEETATVVRTNAKTFFLKDVGATLMYPLPIAFLIFTFLKFPESWRQVSSLTDLILHVFNLCCIKLKAHKSNSKRSFKTKEKMVNFLLQSAWQVATEKTPSNTFLHDENITYLFEAMKPFFLLSENTENHNVSFIHPLVSEVLAGFYLGNIVQQYKWTLADKLKRVSRCLPESVHNMVAAKSDWCHHVLLHMSGFLELNKSLTKERAIDIVLLLNSTVGVSARDYKSWLSVLNHSNLNPDAVQAVAKFLCLQRMWSFESLEFETHRSLESLLRYGAFQPSMVVFRGEDDNGMKGIARALTNFGATIRVHVELEDQYYSWEGSATCDGLLEVLQSARSLRVLWGHLGPKGAMLLRLFSHLTEVNIRISSLEALLNLASSLKKGLCHHLKYLYLRHDCDPGWVDECSLPSFPALQPRGSLFWFHFRSISDPTVPWVVKACRRMCTECSQVIFEESNLSKNAQSYLKGELASGLREIIIQSS